MNIEDFRVLSRRAHLRRVRRDYGGQAAQPEARGEGADGQAEGDHEDDVTIDLFNGLLDEPEPETDKEILNDITGEKLRAYDWLTAGCPP